MKECIFCSIHGEQTDCPKCVNDELVKACKALVHRAECMSQSHQCREHKGGDCCDLTYMLEAIMEGKNALKAAESS